MSAEGLPWSERFKPTSLQEIVGNYTSAEQLMKWVKGRLQGEGGLKRAALVHGPPGTGKTLSVELVAEALDLELIEMNASDFRTEELVERVAGGAAAQGSLFGKRGKLIFMDEIDGISGREDKGGLSAIISTIKDAKYPVVLAANDPWDPRFRNLREVCELIPFKRIRKPSIVVFLRKVAKKAGVNASESALERIAEFSNGDLRVAINDFQMLATGKQSLDELDVRGLQRRIQARGAFEVMKDLFSSGSCLEAKLALEGASMDPEMAIQWINENIPNQYQSTVEREEAFDWLSKSDIFIGRASRWQAWDLIGYALELATGGAALSRRGEYRFTKYSFPKRISMLSLTKEERGVKREILQEIAKENHVSRKKAALEYLPYIEFLSEAKKGRS
ncbi:MAG: replication factor C large subunit [Candidatus Verstraetearchaeota archaeon]|nr:replication factor C large subunit [Candidatus Verstraetearchaeota archaeon]